MGRFFTSFDEAWEFFVDRETDLEDFFARFPLDDHFLLWEVVGSVAFG